VSLVLVLDLLLRDVCGVVGRRVRLRMLRLMLLRIIVCLLEWLLMLVVTVVRLTFPPGAVYHTGKMHSHEEATGSQGGWACVMWVRRDEEATRGSEGRGRVPADVENGHQDLGAWQSGTSRRACRRSSTMGGWRDSARSTVPQRQLEGPAVTKPLPAGWVRQRRGTLAGVSCAEDVANYH
jgi:hypothetical protein